MNRACIWWGLRRIEGLNGNLFLMCFPTDSKASGGNHIFPCDTKPSILDIPALVIDWRK